MPGPEERLKIWKISKPSAAELASDVNLEIISGKYELSGSAIVSVIHYASLQTIYRNSTVIAGQDIIDGIKREYEKDERVFN
jgi:ATP-dependent 26S proteasome regulatory subunit